MSKLPVILWAATLLAQTEELRNPQTSPEDVAAGAKTFRSHCAPCHGLNGEGGRGPNLVAGVFHHGSSDRDLLTNISEGIAGTEMPGLFYSADRVWQVVAYIRSLSSASGAKPAGNPVAGRKLFQQKGCGQCHIVKGEGGRLGPDLTSIGKTRSIEHLRRAIIDPNADVRARYWVVSLTHKNGTSYSGFLMNEDTYTVQFMDFAEQLHSIPKADLKEYKVEKISKMPSYKETLTAGELNDLVAYLWSLRPSGGEQ